MNVGMVIFIFVAALIMFSVGYECGRDKGIDIGRRQTYHDWAKKIQLQYVEDEYVDEKYSAPAPRLVDTPRWRIRFRRKHRKPIIDMERWEISKQYFGDWIAVKKPDKRKKRFTKAYIRKMVKELADELGVDMKGEVKD